MEVYEELYEKTMFLSEVYRKLNEAETSAEKGNVYDAFDALAEIRSKYEL